MAVVTGVLTTGEPIAVPPPFGKVQSRLAPVAVSVKVPPVHTGFGEAVTFVGAPGVDGSESNTGPANAAEGQPFKLTIKLV